MSRLYEKFILEYYAQEYGQRLKGFSSRALQISWQLDDGYDELLPVMQTDITLTYRDQTLIIDAKYYERTLQTNFDVQTLHSGNMYQILSSIFIMKGLHLIHMQEKALGFSFDEEI